MKRIIGTLAALAMVAAAVSAHATTFLFSYTSNDATQGASGTLHATLVAAGQFQATSGTINAFGPLSTGAGTLTPGSGNSPSGFFFYDSLLTPTQNPLISGGGLLFNIAGDEVNIYSDGPGPETYRFYSRASGVNAGNFALTQVGGAVPEPASWALMIGGFGLAGAALRRRRTTVTA